MFLSGGGCVKSSLLTRMIPYACMVVPPCDYTRNMLRKQKQSSVAWPRLQKQM